MYSGQKFHLWDFGYTGILTAAHYFWKKSTQVRLLCLETIYH